MLAEYLSGRWMAWFTRGLALLQPQLYLLRIWLQRNRTGVSETSNWNWNTVSQLYSILPLSKVQCDFRRRTVFRRKTAPSRKDASWASKCSQPHILLKNVRKRYNDHCFEQRRGKIIVPRIVPEVLTLSFLLYRSALSLSTYFAGKLRFYCLLWP